MKKKVYEKMIRFQEVLELKVGSQVMYLVNDKGLVNGHRGVVVDFCCGYPLVKFTD